MQKEFDNKSKKTDTTDTRIPILQDPLSPNSRMKVTITSVTNEMKEREDRRPNMIIYNAEEQETNIKEERNQNDKDMLKDVFKNTLKVKIKDTDITRLTRLGEKKFDKKRPILVVFDNPDTKDTIFKNLAKLRYTDYKHLSFAHDMTELERNNYKKLLEEAKKKQAECSAKNRYQV